MSTYGSIQQRFGYRELNVAKWNDPRGSVHPSRGGPRNPLVPADSAAKPYQPTYKVSYRRPPPQATDDEDSEIDGENEPTEKATESIIPVDPTVEPQEPTVVQPIPETDELKVNDDEKADGEVLKTDITASNGDELSQVTSLPESEAIQAAPPPEESSEIPLAVEQVKPNIVDNENDARASNNDEPSHTSDELGSAHSSPSQDEPAEPAPAAEESKINADGSNADTETMTPAEEIAEVAQDEKTELAASPADEIDGHDIPPPAPEPPTVHEDEVQSSDSVESQEPAPDPVAPSTQATDDPHVEERPMAIEPELPAPVESQSEPLKEELSPVAEIVDSTVIIEPSTPVEGVDANPPLKDDATAIRDVEQVKTDDDIDSASPVVAKKEPRMPTPEPQLDDGEDKKVSWAPGTPEPKPTIRKKKSSKSSKAKSKKKSTIREEPDPDEIMEVVDVVDGVDVPVSPPPTIDTNDDLEAKEQAKVEEPMPKITPTSSGEAAGAVFPSCGDVETAIPVDQVTPESVIEVPAEANTVSPVSVSLSTEDEQSQSSAIKAAVPEKTTKKKSLKSSKEKIKDGGKKKSSSKSKNKEEIPPAKSDPIISGSALIDDGTSNGAKDVSSASFSAGTEVLEVGNNDSPAKDATASDVLPEEVVSAEIPEVVRMDEPVGSATHAEATTEVSEAPMEADVLAPLAVPGVDATAPADILPAPPVLLEEVEAGEPNLSADPKSESCLDKVDVSAQSIESATAPQPDAVEDDMAEAEGIVVGDKTPETDDSKEDVEVADKVKVGEEAESALPLESKKGTHTPVDEDSKSGKKEQAVMEPSAEESNHPVDEVVSTSDKEPAEKSGNVLIAEVMEKVESAEQVENGMVDQPAEEVEPVIEAKTSSETQAAAEAQSTQEEPPTAESGGETESTESILDSSNVLMGVEALSREPSGGGDAVDDKAATETVKAPDHDNKDLSESANTEVATALVEESKLLEEKPVESSGPDERDITISDVDVATDSAALAQNISPDTDQTEIGGEERTAVSDDPVDNEVVTAETLAADEKSHTPLVEDLVKEGTRKSEKPDIPDDGGADEGSTCEATGHAAGNEDAPIVVPGIIEGDNESKEIEKIPEVPALTPPTQAESAASQAGNMDTPEGNAQQINSIEPEDAVDSVEAHRDKDTGWDTLLSATNQIAVVVEEVVGEVSQSGGEGTTEKQGLPDKSGQVAEDDTSAAMDDAVAVTPVESVTDTSPVVLSQDNSNASADMDETPPSSIEDPEVGSSCTLSTDEAKQDSGAQVDDAAAPERQPNVKNEALAIDEADVSKAITEQLHNVTNPDTSTSEPERQNVPSVSAPEEPGSTAELKAEPEIAQSEATKNEDPTSEAKLTEANPSVAEEIVDPGNPVANDVGVSHGEFQNPDEPGPVPNQEDAMPSSNAPEERADSGRTQAAASDGKASPLDQIPIQVQVDDGQASPVVVAEPSIVTTAEISDPVKDTTAVEAPAVEETAQSTASTPAETKPFVEQIVGPEPMVDRELHAEPITEQVVEPAPILEQILEAKPVTVTPPSPTTSKKSSSKRHSRHSERTTKKGSHDAKPPKSIDVPKSPRRQNSRYFVQEPRATHVRKPTRVSMTAADLEEEADRRRRRAARKAAETARLLQEEQKLALENEQRLEREAEERRVRREARRAEKRRAAEEADRKAREQAEAAASKEEYRRRRRRDSVREQDVRPNTRDGISGIFSLPRSFTGESANKAPSFTRTGTGGSRSSGSRDHRTRPTSSRHSAEGQSKTKTPNPVDDVRKEDLRPPEIPIADVSASPEHRPHRKHRHRSDMERPRSDRVEGDRPSSNLKEKDKPPSGRRDGDRRTPLTPGKEEKKKKPGFFGRLFA